jgi:hypothetical protein
MLQQLIDQLPENIHVLIQRTYSDKQKLVPIWYVEIDRCIKESGGDLQIVFNKAKERWENGRNS